MMMNDEPIAYLRDVDGTGSFHVCAKGDPGSFEVFGHPYFYALAAGSGTGETNEDSARCEASQSDGEAVTPERSNR